MPVINTIQVRRDTAANWTSTNPTLAAGEIGFESNTGKFKIGTGSANWATLLYAAALPTHSHLFADLTDFAISSPSNGQTLTYNSSTSKWVNSTASASTGGEKISSFLLMGA